MLRTIALHISQLASAIPRHSARIAGSSRRALKALGAGGGGWASAQGLFGAAAAVASGGAARASLNTSALAAGAAASGLLPASFQFKEMGLLAWLGVDLAINVAGWAVATLLKTETFYDALGSVSFLTLTLGSLLTSGPITPRKLLVSCMVGMWTVRLGSYLVKRIHKVGKDSRFDEVKHQPLTFLFFWVMQAAWVFVTLSPVLVINGAAATAPLALADLLGVSVFGLGFGFEVVADWQKDAFRADPANKGKFITEGLWSLSRHPNYFGESLLWWGVFFTCARSFTSPVQFATVASPVFVYMLIRYLSGVPILEKQADERWGHLEEYQRYKAATPEFFPALPGKGHDA